MLKLTSSSLIPILHRAYRSEQEHATARAGYARVSSVGQSLEVQLDRLAGCACDKTYQERKSGSGDGGKRPGLEGCLEYVREGDTLLVTRLDRLARSTLHL